MAEYRLTPRSQADLKAIWSAIASDNEAAADRLLSRFFDRFDLAAHHPFSGVARNDVAQGARILIEGRYIAIYETTDYGILVVAIVHGMRDDAAWLS